MDCIHVLKAYCVQQWWEGRMKKIYIYLVPKHFYYFWWHTTVSVLNATEFFTSKSLLLCDINFTSIIFSKLFIHEAVT